MDYLLSFDHGLGDAVQLTAVLQWLKKHQPDDTFDVLTLPGKDSVVRGCCRNVITVDRDQFWQWKDKLFATTGLWGRCIHLDWPECWEDHRGTAPMTKPSKCINEVFGGTPESNEYHIAISDECMRKARQYLAGVTDADPHDGRWPVVAIHYEANSGSGGKNISHEEIGELCDVLLEAGFTPLILDWDNRSPLPQREGIVNPGADDPLWGHSGSGDGELLAAVIQQCALMIGVDSGPLHVAGATDTPTIGLWRDHFAGQFFDPAGNVLHLIPFDWKSKGIADRDCAQSYFTANYRYAEFAALSNRLAPTALELLGMEKDGHVRMWNHWIRLDNKEQDCVIARDVYIDDCYRLSLIPGIVEQAELIVDVGGCIGSFAIKANELNPSARIHCVEVCPENWPTIEMNLAEIGNVATLHKGACTYESGNLWLLNAVRPNCESTGGSIVVTEDVDSTSNPDWNSGYQYRADKRPIEKFTLEQIMEDAVAETIDLLKLDCEGSEYSILTTPSLDRIKFIVGEFHDPARWDAFRSERFPVSDWDYGEHYRGENGGLFHLSNRRYWT